MPGIDRQLREKFEQHADQPDHAEKVIVTLVPGADRAELEHFGMVVTSQLRNLPIVLGTITSANLNALSGWSEVERVELDASNMRALDE